MKIYDNIIFNLATKKYHIGEDIVIINDWFYKSESKIYFADMISNDVDLNFNIGMDSKINYGTIGSRYGINAVSKNLDMEEISFADIHKFIDGERKAGKKIDFGSSVFDTFFKETSLMFNDSENVVEFIKHENDYDMCIKETFLFHLDIATEIRGCKDYISLNNFQESFFIEKETFVEFISQWIKFNEFLIENKLLPIKHFDYMIRTIEKTRKNIENYENHLVSFYDVYNNEDITTENPRFKTITNQITELCPNIIYDINYKK